MGKKQNKTKQKKTGSDLLLRIAAVAAVAPYYPYPDHRNLFDIIIIIIGVSVGKTSKSKDYRKDTSNEKPVNNTPGQRVDGSQNPINDETKVEMGRSYSKIKGQ